MTESTTSESIFPTLGMEDCLRVSRLINPAFSEMGPVTWQAGFQVVDYNWHPWLQECFAQKLLPLLGESLRLASGGMGRELIELDGGAMSGMTPGIRESSGRAGRLLLRKGVPSGAKVLQKLATAVSSGHATGHLVTVFAARSSIFSIPPRQAALAYLYTELSLGAPDWTDRQFVDRLQESLPVIETWLCGMNADNLVNRKWSHG